MSKASQITVLALGVVLAFVIGLIVGESISKNTSLMPGQNVAPSSLVIDGQRIPIVPGTTVEVDIEEEENTPVIVNTSTGIAKGADLSTSVDTFAQSFQAGAPTLRMNGAYGSATDAIYTVKGLAAKGHMVLIFAGILCVVGGAVCWAKWDKKMGIYIGLAGIALILIGVLLESYPWVALVIPIVGVGGIIYFWLRARKGKEQDTALVAIVGGIDKLKEVSKATVTKAISAEAKANGEGPEGVKMTVRKVVAEIKKEVA